MIGQNYWKIFKSKSLLMWIVWSPVILTTMRFVYYFIINILWGHLNNSVKIKGINQKYKKKFTTVKKEKKEIPINTKLHTDTNTFAQHNSNKNQL